MNLAPLAGILAGVSLLLPTEAAAATTCTKNSCAAQGVVLLQQRPGEFIPSQRGSPLLESHQALQMALDQSRSLQQQTLKSQRALDQMTPSVTALVQETPIENGFPAAVSQMATPGSVPVQAALAQMTLPVSQSFAVTPGAGIAQAAAASQ